MICSTFLTCSTYLFPVSPAMDEPVKGWLFNFSAPSTLLFAGGSGFNHVIRGSKTNIVDFVPVDYVVNLAIVAPTVCRRFVNSKL